MFRRVLVVVILVFAALFRPTIGEEGMYPITSIGSLKLKEKGL
jgi:hypothetical protein